MSSKRLVTALSAMLAGASVYAFATSGGASTADSKPFALLARSSTSAADGQASFISRSWMSVEATLSAFSTLPKSYFSIVIR